MRRMVNGIQEVAIGVSDAQHAFNWYRKNFGADVVLSKHEGRVPLMQPYTGQIEQSRQSILAINMQGGGGFKVWQYTSRIPEPPIESIQLGDTGIFAVKLRSKDINVAYRYFQKSGVTILTEPVKNVAGVEHFFIRDPYNNIFDIVQDEYCFSKTDSCTGGISGVVIGVKDINESIAFYKTVLGYDHMISKTAGIFDDFESLPGGEHIFKRAILGHKRASTGAFGKLFGPGYVELVEVQSRVAKTIYADRIWGDLGFMHVCYDVSGMTAHQEVCKREGYDFTVDNHSVTDAAGNICCQSAYGEDPDGSLIKYIEAKKLALLNNLLKIDLTKRLHEKPLPDWIVKCLRFKRTRV